MFNKVVALGIVEGRKVGKLERKFIRAMNEIDRMYDKLSTNALIGFVKGANFVIGKVAPKMPQIKLDLYTRLATGEYCNRLYFEKAIETPDVFSWKGTQKGGADNGEQFATTALLKGYSPKQTLAADLLKAGDVRITFKASDDGRMVTKTGREWSIEVAHHPDGFVGKFTLPDGTLVGSKP